MTVSWRGGLVVWVAALMVSGCSVVGSGSSPEEELRSRPSYEQAGREYLVMLEAMRAEISAAVPSLRWKTEKSYEDETRAGCAEPYAGLNGTTGFFDTGDATGAVPDADWPAVVEIVTRIGAEHGFTQIVTLVDQPGHHVVNLYDGYESRIRMGTKVGTTLAVFGACFLEESVRASSSG
jgi:hypothetical protein